MKKSLLYLLIAVMGFSACQKKDSRIFDQTPDERINEVLDNYASILTSAPNGWRGLVYPSGANGGVFGFYFKFNNSNRVEMFADIDSASSVTMKESSYRLKALQQPSLIFDTYSYLHVLADPDASQNGGVYGAGLSSDFEFAIDTVAGDTVKLTGRFHGSKAVLIKASQQEANAYYNGDYGNRSIDRMGDILYYFKQLIIGSRKYDIAINTTYHTITFTWKDGSGAIQTFTTGYYYTPDGIALANPLNDGSNTFSSLDNITWNGSSFVLNLQVNGSAGTINGVNTPLVVDKQAPQRWWQYAVSNGNNYWISVDGFHVNGVDDAYGIKTLTTDTSYYYYLIYWPGIGSSGGSAYDVMTPAYFIPTANSLDIIYGTAQRPVFLTDGRVLFSYLGDLLVGPYPSSGPAADTRTQLYDSGGYYFVQTSPTSYDMVSAADARRWITWYYIF